MAVSATFCLGLFLIVRLISFPELVKNVQSLALVGIIGYLLANATAIAARWVIGPSAKVLLDIFRYVGDPSYRNLLQHQLSQQILQLSSRGKNQFILVAHSLGSVIAMDSLLSSCAWASSAEVTLITMGSPLRRFFFRFFPDLYFPPSAYDCEIKVRPNRFRWLNCYRRFDYIGSSLGGKRSEHRLDICTGQILRFHTGYWDDPLVARLIESNLRRLPFSTRLTCPEDPCPPDTWDDFSAPHRIWIYKGALRSSLFLVLSALVFILSFAIFAGTKQFDRLIQRNQETVSASLHTRADALFWTQFIPGPQQGTFEDHVKIAFRTDDGTEFTWSREVHFFDRFTAGAVEDDWRFSYKFIDYLKRDCLKGCAIDILVHPSNRRYFVVPGYVPKFGFYNRFVASVSYLFLGVLCAVPCIFLALLLVPIFEIVIGERPGLSISQTYREWLS